MILDEIQKEYFRKSLMNVENVELKISFDTYSAMLKEDIRVVNQGLPNDSKLKPMFGRSVIIDHNLNCAWSWMVLDRQTQG